MLVWAAANAAKSTEPHRLPEDRVNRTILCNLGLVLLFFAVTSCGTSVPADAPDIAAADSADTADTGCLATDTCAPCTGTLESANVWGTQGCPATFDGVTVDLPCNSPFEIRYTANCGGFRVLRRGHGTHSAECFYTPDKGALVAVKSDDDVRTFCSHTSFYITGGPVPVETCLPQLTKMTPNCP